MIKRTIARLLLFGVPFTFAYLASRPAPKPEAKPFVICAFPGGEIRISPDASRCTEESSKLLAPAARVMPPVEDPNSGQVKLSF